MGRRGPEKIGPASSSSEPTGESSGIETLSSPVESREAPSLENASAGAAAAPPGASSCRKAKDSTEGRLVAEGDRPTGVRGAMASRLGRRRRLCCESGSGAAQVVLDGPVSVYERIPAPRFRDLVPPGGIPVPVPPDAGVQRPPSAGTPLHGPPDPRRRATHRGAGA